LKWLQVPQITASLSGEHCISWQPRNTKNKVANFDNNTSEERIV